MFSSAVDHFWRSIVAQASPRVGRQDPPSPQQAHDKAVAGQGKSDGSGVSPGKWGVVAEIGGKAEGRAAPAPPAADILGEARGSPAADDGGTAAGRPVAAHPLPSPSTPLQHSGGPPSFDELPLGVQRPSRGRRSSPGPARRAGGARRARGAVPEPGPRGCPHACGDQASPPSAGRWKARTARAGRRLAATRIPSPPGSRYSQP